LHKIEKTKTQFFLYRSYKMNRLTIPPPINIFEPRSSSLCAGHFCDCGQGRVEMHTPPRVEPETPRYPPPLQRQQRFLTIDSPNRERTLSYEPSQPVEQHLFFDENGIAISRQEFLDMNWKVKLPDLQNLTARHPRVLLAYLEFIEAYNDISPSEENIMLPAISPLERLTIQSHSTLQTTPRAFRIEISRLKELLNRHYES
jgi:hypothetical protein